MSTKSSVNVAELALTHPDISKRTNLSALALSAAIMLLGILLFLGVFILPDSSSAGAMLLLVVGVGLFFFGLIRLFQKFKQAVYLPTGGVLKEHQLYFDLKELSQLKDLAADSKLCAEVSVKSTHSGNVRMDVALSSDGKFAAVQLLQFVPYVYKPVSNAYYYVGHEATAVSAFVQQCKKHLS
ncbi:MAG: hypothetical protein LBL97_09595 [Prevotellaceae bacterium]|jgi:hypothetical protein|nr:hypothetical protein [Prevotellaceae bacterium]